MSFICGIVKKKKRDSRPDITLQDMIDRGAFIEGVTNITHWVRKPRVFVSELVECALTRWTYMQEPHSEPFTCGSYVITWDGILYNKADLVRRLVNDGVAISNEAQDSEIVLKLYLYLGSEFLCILNGDYAFSIANLESCDVFCARSPLGVRPLYYVNNVDYFAWASNLYQLTTVDSIRSNLDEDYIREYAAEYLCSIFHSRMTLTPCKNVYKLLPGFCASISKDSMSVYEFWRPRVYQFPRSFKENDYIEQFKEFFYESIEARLRHSKEISISLSGGLDSSSIAFAISDLRRRGRSVPAIVLSHDVHEGRGDEMRYARIVADGTGFPLRVRYSKEDNWLFKDMDPIKVLVQPSESVLQRISPSAEHDELESNSVKPMFTGSGGDHILLGSLDYLGGLLRTGRIFSFVTEARKVARSINMPTLLVMTNFGLIPVIKYVPYLDRSKGLAYTYFTKEFVDKYDVHGRRNRRNVRRIFADPSSQSDYEELMMCDQWSDSGSSCFDIRCPFLDIRLVEYCLSLPGQLKNDGKVGKVILRKAMKGIVDDRILARRTKGYTLDSIRVGTNKEWNRLSRRFGRFWLERLGIFVPGSLENMLRHLKSGTIPWGTTSAVRILSLEFWLEGILEGDQVSKTKYMTVS